MSTNTSDRVRIVSAELAEFIATELNWDGATDDLLGSTPVELPAILDSSDLLELAGHLEDTYGIEIANDEIVPETFATVQVLAGVVVAKQEELAAP